jgi:rod shape determining protein RodA
MRDLDFGFLITVLMLIGFGLLAIYSATYVSDAQDYSNKFNRQMIWAIVSLGVVVGVTFLSPRILMKYAYIAYFLSVALLVLVLFVGGGAGTRRWLDLGLFTMQPSELAKITTLLALARFLSREVRGLMSYRDLIFAFSFSLVPFLLIMNQPDLGSALVFLGLTLPVLHWGGMRNVVLFVVIAPVLSLISAFNYYSFFAVMVLICLMLFLSHRGIIFFLVNFIINIGVGIITPIVWGLLKDYQQNRILTFLGIVVDPRGLGYQVIQSKVAIGSGGFAGKGFLAGTQTHLRFLPEQHTDFIFCVIAEEFGFLGVLMVLTLFLLLVFKGFTLASSVKSKFLSIIVFGATIIFLMQVFINVGMTVGIMPVTGLPLPFLSYGGSSLLTNMVLIGLILNASRKRFEYI